MPKYAILSDIHSNAEAFEAVLDKCRSIKVDHYLFLGDLVGYNTDVRRCLDLAKELNFLAGVRGNHDEAAVRKDGEAPGFNTNAAIAIEWTRTQLTAEDVEFLDSLPYRRNVPGTPITLVHATLDSPETWGYVFDSHHAVGNFSYQLSQLCFCGHSHVPVAFEKVPFAPGGRLVEVMEQWEHSTVYPPADDDFTISDELEVRLAKGHKYLFNIGSIGQPRNGDNRASFAVFDSDAQTVTRYRVPYDIAAVQAKIREAGLPERLAARLEWGR
ncbi:MAG: metallophosphoesterase family protein [Lentisphaerae bacterium]|nr:metallophosphoesterase family protein [Lentisphaerota bacterium]